MYRLIKLSQIIIVTNSKLRKYTCDYYLNDCVILLSVIFQFN